MLVVLPVWSFLVELKLLCCRNAALKKKKEVKKQIIFFFFFKLSLTRKSMHAF